MGNVVLNCARECNGVNESPEKSRKSVKTIDHALCVAPMMDWTYSKQWRSS